MTPLLIILIVLVGIVVLAALIIAELHNRLVALRNGSTTPGAD